MATVNEKMTAIADAIRNKTGGTEALTLDDMASGVNEVYEAGIEKGKNYWWDILTNNDTRKGGYTSLFYRCSFEEIYPPYPLQINSSYGTTNYMFAYNSKLKRVGNNVFNCINSVEAQYMFSNCSNLEEIDTPLKFSKCIGAFYDCQNLKTITNLSVCYGDASYLFQRCYELKNIGFDKDIRDCSLDLSYSSKLTLESLKNLITHLYDYVGNNKTTTYKITLNSVSKELLEAEGATSPNGNTWIEYVADLGWTLK